VCGGGVFCGCFFLHQPLSSRRADTVDRMGLDSLFPRREWNALVENCDASRSMADSRERMIAHSDSPILVPVR